MGIIINTNLTYINFKKYNGYLFFLLLIIDCFYGCGGAGCVAYRLLRNRMCYHGDSHDP